MIVIRERNIGNYDCIGPFYDICSVNVLNSSTHKSNILALYLIYTMIFFIYVIQHQNIVASKIFIYIH